MTKIIFVWCAEADEARDRGRKASAQRKSNESVRFWWARKRWPRQPRRNGFWPEPFTIIPNPSHRRPVGWPASRTQHKTATAATTIKKWHLKQRSRAQAGQKGSQRAGQGRREEMGSQRLSSLSVHVSLRNRTRSSVLLPGQKIIGAYANVDEAQRGTVFIPRSFAHFRTSCITFRFFIFFLYYYLAYAVGAFFFLCNFLVISWCGMTSPLLPHRKFVICFLDSWVPSGRALCRSLASHSSRPRKKEKNKRIWYLWLGPVLWPPSPPPPPPMNYILCSNRK